MTEPDPYVRDGLTRQRRALLATSTVLLLYEAAGIRITDISVLGTHVSIERPGLIPLALWVLWAYFLLRYSQYFHDLSDRGFDATYRNRLHDLGRGAAIRKFRREFRPLGDPAQYLPPYSLDLEPVGFVSEGPGGWDLQFKGAVTYRTQAGLGHQTFHDYPLTLSRLDLFVPRIRAVFHVATKTRLGTEYVLPFLVAAAPLVYRVIAWVLHSRAA